MPITDLFFSEAIGTAAAVGEAVTRGAIVGTGFSDRLYNDSTLTQSQYDFRYRTFPEDLSNDYVGHYMVININVPVFAAGGAARTSYRAGQTILDEYSKVDALRFGGAESIPGSNILFSPPAEREPFSIPRFTRRIAESIALFMPTPVVFNSQNEYQEISLTALGGGLATSAAAVLGGAFYGERGAEVAGGITDAVGNVIGQTSRLAGFPINPRVEVMFSRTHLRQFVFEFLMAPRNEKESETMKAIIQTLRYHGAPEIDPITQGFTFIPPAEFDVTFYNKGIENTNIPRINTCVLDRIEVDYSPTGTYSTFTNGHPVTARLSLGMREIEVVHKRRVLQGF
jgi:hypothetical protein